MNLSECKNKDALDFWAEIIEPAAEIMGDKEIGLILRTGQAPVKAIKVALKRHKEAVIAIMAALEGSTPEEYEFDAISLPKKVLGIINNQEFKMLFQSQGQTTDKTSSGSVTATTGGDEL